jgi:hypothetical protein
MTNDRQHHKRSVRARDTVPKSEEHPYTSCGFVCVPTVVTVIIAEFMCRPGTAAVLVRQVSCLRLSMPIQIVLNPNFSACFCGLSASVLETSCEISQLQHSTSLIRKRTLAFYTMITYAEYQQPLLRRR